MMGHSNDEYDLDQNTFIVINIWTKKNNKYLDAKEQINNISLVMCDKRASLNHCFSLCNTKNFSEGSDDLRVICHQIKDYEAITGEVIDTSFLLNDIDIESIDLLPPDFSVCLYSTVFSDQIYDLIHGSQRYFEFTYQVLNEQFHLFTDCNSTAEQNCAKLTCKILFDIGIDTRKKDIEFHFNKSIIKYDVGNLISLLKKYKNEEIEAYEYTQNFDEENGFQFEPEPKNAPCVLM